MRAATVVQQSCKSCRTCFKFYCMFYFTCDRSLSYVRLSERGLSCFRRDMMTSQGHLLSGVDDVTTSPLMMMLMMTRNDEDDDVTCTYRRRRRCDELVDQ